MVDVSRCQKNSGQPKNTEGKNKRIGLLWEMFVCDGILWLKIIEKTDTVMTQFFLGVLDLLAISIH